MNVIRSEQIIPVDVDGTLILWSLPINHIDCLDYMCPYTGKTKRVSKHLPNLIIFEERLARGAHFLIWSASGYAKAAAVVEALGYKDHPQITVLGKPVCYMDDIPCSEWMGPRVWLEPDSKYGA